MVATAALTFNESTSESGNSKLLFFSIVNMAVLSFTRCGDTPAPSDPISTKSLPLFLYSLSLISGMPSLASIPVHNTLARPSSIFLHSLINPTASLTSQTSTSSRAPDEVLLTVEFNGHLDLPLTIKASTLK